MNLNNFTIKAQEAIQHAFLVAQGNNQQAVETGHILKGLFHSAENVVGFLLKKLGVNINIFGQAIDKILNHIPKLQAGINISHHRPTGYCKSLLHWHRKWATSLYRLSIYWQPCSTETIR